MYILRCRLLTFLPGILRVNEGGNKYVNIVFAPLGKGIDSKWKEFAALGSRFLPFKVQCRSLFRRGLVYGIVYLM